MARDEAMDDAAAMDDDEQVSPPPPSLPKLLSALALGVRAVNSLPAPSKTGRDDDDDEEEDDGGDGDDEFAYRMAFPEFSSLCHEGRTVLATLLSESLESIGGDDSTNADEEDDVGPNDGGEDDGSPPAACYDFEDPLLWEKAAEACDSLLERVDAYVQSVRDGDTSVSSGAVAGAASSKERQLLENAAARAREKARGGYRMMMDGIVDMEKPQITYDFAGTINNSRREPFVPAVHPDKPYSVLPLSETLKPKRGHGLESRNGELAGGPTKVPDDVVAPDVHYPHQYEEEIESLSYRDWQLQVESDDVLGEHGLGGTLNRAGDDGSAVPTARGLWIDTESDLERLARRINSSDGGGGQQETVREMAVDLEAHSHRSYSGFVCLMQISLRRPARGSSGGPSEEEDGNKDTIETASDFLVDTIALRRVINRHLAPAFANPDIVKVMHGADSDIPWLQRDFGIYVVNLFDTGRAARALPHFSSAGLAYLLGRYAGVEANKKHQLSDWRRRPLPADMMAYATSDTTYLLDIYDRIKLELESHPEADVTVRSVLDESKKVCLVRYDKEPFKPSGYKTLINSKRGKRKRSSTLDPKHEGILMQLYDWRDRTARDLDESLNYVCPNSALVRIATMCPRTVGNLQGLINPCPPLVVRCADEILGVIKRATLQKQQQQDVGAGAQEATAAAAASTTTKPVTSSPEKISQLRASASPFAFFKPAEGGGGGGSAHQPRASPTSSGDRDLPPRPPSDRSNAGILSPVVGTEALFKQAGWMTPQSDPAAVATDVGVVDAPVEGQTTTEDESDGPPPNAGQQKRRQLLAVDGANENYVATRYTEHSLEMASLVDEEAGGGKEDADKRRGRTVDGLGAAREALSREGGGGGIANEPSVEHGTVVAKKSAMRIRDDLASGKHGLVSLTRPDVVPRYDVGTDKGTGAANKSKGGDDSPSKEEEEEEYTIPRSMREIYQISNRNRRGKAAAAPASLDEMENALDVDNIDGAEALLASRGPNGYFGGGKAGDGSAIDGRNKRQRTKQQQQELSGALGSKLEDASLMADVGWIKDESEAAEIIAERTDGGDDGAAADEAIPEDTQDGSQERTSAAPSKSKKRGGGGKGGGGGQRAQPPDGGAPPTFDYSKVGAIGAYGPRGAPSLANPFFAGAAVGAGTLSGQQHQGADRKRGGGGGGGKGKNKSGGSGERVGRRDGGNKTFVYRSNQR